MALHFAPLVLTLLGTPGSAAPVAVSTEAAAPSANDMQQIADAFADRVADELALTDEQSSEVRRILRHHVEQMKPHIEYIRAQPTKLAKRRAATKRRAALQKIRAQTDAALQDVLDEAQWETFETLRQKFRDELKARMMG